MSFKLNDFQKRELERLWFIYGNNGEKHTMSNHKFIQHLLQGENHRKFYAPTAECFEAVSKVIDFETIERGFCAGDYVYYRTRKGDSIPAKVLRVFPKTLSIRANMLEGDKTLRVSKSSVVKQPLESASAVDFNSSRA